MRLDAPVTTVKGVGEATAAKLAVLGVQTVDDLLYYFPRRYNDFSQVTAIADIRPGNVTLKARVESVTGRHIRRGMHVTEAVLSDPTGKTRAVWFNQRYRADQLAKDNEYYFSGAYGLQRNRYVLQNPSAELASTLGVSTARIVPVYRETAGFKSHQIRKLIRELLPLIAMLPETLPPQLVTRQKLLPISETLKNIHFPEDAANLERAKGRISFEELLSLLMASALNRHENATLKGWKIPFDESAAKTFVKALPFTMTSAQKRAAWEIMQDFAKGTPMNRLLQGDVGSGKTAVAAMAAYMAARAGLQTAFMAPTEILAAQHANGLAHLLEPLGARVALLVGSTNKKAKDELKKRIAMGDVDIVVGTHALMHSNFNKLGLVVIDEQHRFGVRQRAELLTKSKHMPHLLSMTATPIPRSLQLTLYGELEVSILDELPKGRQPIITKVVSPMARASVYAAIDAHIKKGRQAYVVCPLVSDVTGPNAELKSVQAEHDRLNKSVFKHRRVGLLHGQLKTDQKEAVMRDFKNKKLDLLICTTVVEVGVDVPNATIMLIEGAERFGLAQLHQLRGRVGRGSDQSYCYLVPTSAQSVSRRLRELEQSNDGFYLAEADLALRGPGEIYGRAQHGALDLTFANLADIRLIKRVRAAADWLAKSGIDLLQYKRLHEHVERYRRLTTLN